MAIIKFDSEKADALIKELQKISSDIDSNMGKVRRNSYGKEINLNDSRLKVYAYRNKTVDVVQEDGTVIQEVKRERYLKHNYVSNARTFNQHVRNLYKRSDTAKTKATKSIESVINSLNKVKSLVSEFETEQGLRLSNNMDGVGQFDFNFLSAYGPMGRPPKYSASMGAVIADEAYTSLHLGILGQRPTSINLEKLPVFDGIFGIVIDKGLSYQEKFENVKELLMDNVLEVDPEVMNEKSKLAIESMVGIIDSADIKIDDNLRIETLVRLGVPILEDLQTSDLAIGLESVDGVFEHAIAQGGAIMSSIGLAKLEELENLDINNDGKPDLDFNGTGVGELPILNRDKLQNQLGINTDVTLDESVGAGSGVSQNKPYEQGNTPAEPPRGNGGGETSAGVGVSSGNRNSSGPSSQAPIRNEVKPANTQPVNRGSSQSAPVETPKVDRVDNKPVVEASNSALKMNSAPAVSDVVENHEVIKPQVTPEVSSEDMAIDQELQATKITGEYKDSTIGTSTAASGVDVKLDDNVDKKGAGVLAGAAGLGALTNMGGNSGGAGVPQVNGMAAGEILGINSNSGPANMGMMMGDATNSSASTGTVSNSGSSVASAGSEATADRGSLNTNNSNSKPSNTSTSGRGGSTLEDKDNKDQENSFGKPNKPGENDDANKKGMLGDASIAELEAKDEQQIKIATGVTAGTVVLSGVLAIANVLPWIMILLALLAIATYVAYRVKKKKDKEKRKAALVAKKAQEAANATVTMDEIQNVNEVVVEQPNVQTEVSTEAEIVNPVVETPLANDGEFSEQPYEPSRDGVIEIAISSDNETEK